MTLLKTINEAVKKEEYILESAELDDFFDTKGFIVQESIASFVVGAKKLIDSLYTSNNSQTTTQVDQPANISSVESDKLHKFAVILAGLEYFRQKNASPEERKMLEPVLDDQSVTTYVKKIGAEKAQEITDEIKSNFMNGKIMKRDGLDKMIEGIRKFYLSKKFNKGPTLHITAIED